MTQASPRRRPLRVGLTGGIGSGKSTLGQMLQRCGAALVDADACARAVTAAGGSAIPAIRQAFGEEFIDPAGALDRARMREKAFSDVGAKARLEGIVHPLVADSIAQATLEATGAGHHLIVLDIPLLVESKRWAPGLDAVVVVDCSEPTQIARVQARNGLDVPAIEAIIAAQASRAQRRAAADIVVFNDGIPLAELHARAERIAARFGL
ncbi:dephospho-CoA kinase [Acidovorax sp. Leaf160]|uniref:dephospho-CoA kinase n=1 Tax=Acidovorax sp. Leaf160 TaxID=1736280 RepID=UPI000701AD6A|nr:dephospho-CoA kinase [Acidovorax sp. Leaf160]KQR45025.1 dephospho-CoA kinase [Acidovorax sp. Leaf160]